MVVVVVVVRMLKMITRRVGWISHSYFSPYSSVHIDIYVLWKIAEPQPLPTFGNDEVVQCCNSILPGTWYQVPRTPHTPLLYLYQVRTRYHSNCVVDYD